ncbi:MAG: hypothetical protein WA294_14095 [Acidobacteriaceae bacterium]
MKTSDSSGLYSNIATYFLLFCLALTLASFSIAGPYSSGASNARLWAIGSTVFAGEVILLLSARWHYRRHEPLWRKAGELIRALLLAPFHLLGWLIKLPFRALYQSIQIADRVIGGRWWIPFVVAMGFLPPALINFHLHLGVALACCVGLTAAGVVLCAFAESQEKILRCQREILAELRSHPR